MSRGTLEKLNVKSHICIYTAMYVCICLQANVAIYVSLCVFIYIYICTWFAHASD